MLINRGSGLGWVNLRTASLTAATGLGFAFFYLRSPYQHNFLPGDVWRIRLLSIETRILSFIARVGSALRLGSEIEILRHLYGVESWLLSRIPKSDVFTEVLDADGVKIVIYRRLAWVATEDEEEGPLKPCLIYFHGGGWTFCSTEERDVHHRHLIENLDAIIVAVDYRKAPEDPYPAAFRDCVTATKFIFENSFRLGIDKNRISVCGDSSGGNLTATVALKLRDEGKKFLKNQILIYPSVQFLSVRLDSFMQNFPIFSREDGLWCALMYMKEDFALSEALLDGDHLAEDFFEKKSDFFSEKNSEKNSKIFSEKKSDFFLFKNPGFLALQKYDSTIYSESKSLTSSVALRKFRDRIKDPYLCPLMARTMKDLPPTLLLLCEFDILRDDGLAYGDRLRADGVPVQIVKIPGYHGCFRNFQITHCGAMMMDQLVKYLQVHL